MSLEKISDNLISITLEIDEKEFEAALNSAYLESRGKISLPGFRKGRVPRKMIEMQYGKNFFYEEAFDIVFPPAYEETLDDNEIDAVSRPQVKKFDVKDDGGVTIIVEVMTKPEIEVADYSGIEYTKPMTDVLDEEVMAFLEKEREKNARVTTVEDRPAKNGDITDIDFEGFTDGVAFEGGKAENFALTLGSNSFIDTFEAQIEGKNIGETFDVNVTFPEKYHAPNLAGKPAVFKVKLNEIKEKTLPEMDDIFAQEISEFDTLEEFKADVKAHIEKAKNQDAQREIEEQIAIALGKRVDYLPPLAMIENEIDRLITGFARMVEQQGISFEAYMQSMNSDIDTMKLMYQDQATENVKSRLAIEAVVRQENIQVSQEELDREIDTLAPMYRLGKEEFIEAVGKRGMRNIEADVKAQKAMEMIKAVAVAVDRAVAKDEDNESEDN